MNATVEQMKEAIENSSMSTKVYVGCDSKINRRKNKVTYCCVVVLHIDGKHGAHILSQMEYEKVYGDARKPKARLQQELYKAVALATSIMDVIGDREFEIHLDFNSDPRFKSNICVKEAIGFVRGMGFGVPKMKPYSWAATTAADRFT